MRDSLGLTFIEAFTIYKSLIEEILITEIEFTLRGFEECVTRKVWEETRTLFWFDR